MSVPITFIQANASNYVVGRGGCPTLVFYLHSEGVSLNELDALACRKLPAGRAPRTYHYAVQNYVVHQYVLDADTAITFGSTPANPPVPGKPLGCSDDQTTINIALTNVIAASNPDNCDDQTVTYDPATLSTLAQLLCQESKVTGLPISALTVLLDPLDLPDFPLADVIAEANACINFVITSDPCDCDITVQQLTDVVCLVPDVTPAQVFDGFLVKVDNAGACQVAIADIGDVFPPVAGTACAQTPEQVAWTVNGWRPVQSKRPIYTTSGAFTPVDLEQLVKATGNITLNPPSACGYTLVVLKNYTSSNITVTGSIDGIAQTITLSGTNADNSGRGESRDFEWDGSTYILH